MIKRFFVLLFLLVLASIFATLLSDYTPDSVLNYTAQYYAEHTAQDLGATNIVTAIIVTYRGLDTIGEVTVLFLTAAIVGLLLSQGGRKSKSLQRKLPILSFPTWIDFLISHHSFFETSI